MSPEQEQQEHRDDCRRAAALVAHHGQASLDGINAILEEAAEANRVSELIVAVLNLYQSLVPELRSATAQKLMADWVYQIAGRP